MEEALESPVVFDYAITPRAERLYDPEPVKFQSGTPTRQKGRLYDRTLAWTHNKRTSAKEETQPREAADSS